MTNQASHEQLLAQRKRLLQAVVEKPSHYHVKVEDNSMLPAKMKNKKEVSFTVKPPTIEVLAQCAIYFNDIPEDLLNPEKQIRLNDVLPYHENMVKALCTIINRSADYEDWYEPFIYKHLTPREVFQIFHETSLKMGTDFFLTSFQIASQTNPMMLRNPKDSTLTGS